MTKRSYLIAAVLGLVVGAAIVVPAAARSHHSSAGPPALKPAQSQRLAHAATPAGSVDADLVPTADGRRCLALTLPDNPNQALGNGGLSCGATPSETTPATEMTAGMSWLRVNSQIVLVIFGRVGSTIADVRLQMADGSTVQTATSNGVYVTRLTAPAIGVLPGAITATGYDSAGQAAASVDLQRQLAASTPPPGSTP